MTPLDIKPNFSREYFDDLIAPLRNGRQDNLQFSTIHRRKDGSEYPVSVQLQAAIFGGVDVFVAVILDTTERYKIDVELRESREKALAAARSKSEFLANMSHEIRTPMTAILGFTDILLGKLTNQEEVDAALAVKANGDYLLKLINDILDLSKIEAGKIDVEYLSCSPYQLITDVASMMRVRLTEKGLGFSIRFDGPIPKTIDTDPTRLRQVLINIVGNAIKFTNSGSVEIVTRMQKDDEEEPKLQINIIDSGIGIAESVIEKLFLPFTQADNSTTRQFGGTGLGLTISKRLVELLGGEISVSSKIDQGSIFLITLPAGTAELEQPTTHTTELRNNCSNDRENKITADQKKSPLKKCRILLAEDGPDNQRLISFILRKAGADVTLVDNGEKAIETVISAMNDNQPFNVILMDMQMPIIDGYSTTQHLRELEYSHPIIALTAHAMASDRQKCLDSGCDDYLTKPIDKSNLINTVASYSKTKKDLAKTV